MNEKLSFRDLLRKKDSDAVLYLIGIIIIAVVILSYFIIGLLTRYTNVALPEICVLRTATGLYCPGCGGTRAFRMLFHGDIIQSIIYHPFVMYAFLIFIAFYISQTVRYISLNRLRGFHMKTCYVVIGAAIIIINWILKNVLLICFHIQLII